MSTLQAVELGVLGPLQVRQGGAPVMIPGAKPRAILTMLGLHSGSVVSSETLIELLWGNDPPRTAAKALQTHISSLRRTLGDGFVLTEGAGWALAESEVDASRYQSAARQGRDAAAANDISQAVARFEEALALWRGIPELPDGRRGTSEKTRWIEGHAALVEDRADALLATGRAAEIIGELEAAVADAPLRERRWGQLMLALYRAGRQGEALGAYQRARALLADELGIDPGPEIRRLETAIVAQDSALEVAAAQQLPSVMRAVTFLLTDIEGSTAAWEAEADAMAVALARHDELIEQVVTSRGGRLIKTRGEGDATFSVFDRPSAAAAAALELQDAIIHEPWALREPMRIRVALHTGEAELRDGDYFGRAVNRAARLRSLATGGQILCSGATAELAIDSLPDDVVLADLGMRQLKNLARPEHVFELRVETADERPQTPTTEPPIERPGLPALLTGPGPFVGRANELERLLSAWQTALAGGMHAVLIAGEPGVGKTRLAGEWSQQAYQQGAVVLYGRCDEDLGAPYQPFTEALRSLVPCVGAKRLRGLRGVEALLALVPGLTDVLPDLAAPTRADPDTERYALFDAVVAVLEVASTSAPVVLILDDLHWAAKPTLLLLRHLLRFGDRARVQIVGTYRSTDLDRSHPLAAMLADLHRDGSANRLQLGGLDEDDVTMYVAEAGYDDEELARALASVTGGNPFFLIEALRHVDESGGVWDPSTLPQGVREAVSRRLSRLPAETNKALAAAAVVGSRFALDLVERVVEEDLVDAFDEACKAGIVIEEQGGRYRFNHAIVRQSLLAELASVRRMRLHQRIATTLEAQPGADDERLAELAYHYFECAWAGNAVKAVEYCRRAADQAMARLAYEGAADLYDRALHALEELDDELPDRDEQAAELLVARCEALLAAGDVASAAGAVSQLQAATVDSARLAAWATCFDGQLSMLIHPERLDEVDVALDAAAQKLAGLDDAAGEAKAHTVRATCLARLGRIADCELALDEALTAARRAREHRRVNAVLANAPLAALWGPNPVPRAGGRCLDVVRLLRITTDSPAVEATSTRCQALLEAFRGRAEAARRMIDSARRTVSELGLRHALLEVEQFAGIVELVADDPDAAESHLRQAYNGFRRMGLDADTAETAALLGRTCLALDRDTEADELCLESERLAGHALKASIAWRTLRARLLSRGNDHDEARRIAEAAVALAERTDALVDHGDACLTLATVLGAGGDAAGARAAAERAVDLYERKGAAALAEKARRILGERAIPAAATPAEPLPVAELDNACVRAGERVLAAADREAWDEFEQLFAPDIFVESHRKIVGFTRIDAPSDWPGHNRRLLQTTGMRITPHVIAVRGERLALDRLVVGTADASPGAPRDEFLQIAGIDESGRISLQIWFDLEDMDAAIAELDAVHSRFEEEHPPARRLENAASQTYERMQACFTARDWDALADTLIDDVHNEDRRRVVNLGVERGRGAALGNVRRAADLGVTHATSDVIATRGKQLVLTHARFLQGDKNPETFHVDVLQLVEIDADERIAALVMFDLGDFDAAIAELDARYLAGEAAAHAQTWSVITGGHAAVNRHELPPTTPDCVSIDHRRGTAFAPGELNAYFRAGWDLDQDIRTYVEVVHRLTDLGAVCTHVGHGVSHQGFDAEWRGVDLLTVEGDMVNRCEVFDEAHLDAAIARFDQLNRPAPRLENAASQAVERYFAHFAARDWDALAKVLADDISIDDRRRVVNAGIRHGRDAEIANLQAAADAGFMYMTSVIIATRGQRLILTRASGRDKGSEEFQSDALGVAEINSHNQIEAIVVFDLDDFDAAIADLDARYLAGEAAAHGNVMQPVMDTVGELNRHKPGPMLGRIAFVDHRRVPFGSAENYGRAIEELWTLVPDARYWTKTVHALDAHGLVSTLVIEGSDAHGNELQWGRTFLFLSDGPRVEVYEEDDVDAAVARFEELRPQARRLENAASQVTERFLACFAARDWDAFAEILADNISTEDRRRVVNAGIRQDRDAEIHDFRSAADLGVTSATSDVIATRGERLVLIRSRLSRSTEEPGAFYVDLLWLVEIDANHRAAAWVTFDLDDFDSAIEELDRRYLAGEAAAHANTWRVISGSYAAINRHERPATTTDWINVEHRREIAMGPGDLFAYIGAGTARNPDIYTYVETVHRLDSYGVVVTYAAQETSQEGFAAEWRGVALLTVEGDLINRSEIFDEADLDDALTRFDQLSQPAPRLENAASRVYDRVTQYYSAGEVAATSKLLAQNVINDDRRRTVNHGKRHGRDAEIANGLAAKETGFDQLTSTVIATRGARLALCRSSVFGRDQQPGAIRVDFLSVVEIDAHEQLIAHVVFDIEDFDAAIAELDARYLAGEAAAHARTWPVIADVFVAHNRRELPATTPDAVSIDHRRGAAFAPGEGFEYIRAGWDLDQNLNTYIEIAHRVNDLGAVFTWAGRGTSHEGFDAEWRGVTLMTVDGEMVSRMEVFDEADLDAALVKFDQLSRPAPRLENAASQAIERFQTCFAARDWDAMAEMMAEDALDDDRRRVVNAGVRRGRDAAIANMQAVADIGAEKLSSTFIATRGERLVLRRQHVGNEKLTEAFQFDDVLQIVEIDADERLATVETFDLDDIGTAIAELDSRYLAGEAAAHEHAWSLVVRAFAAINRHELPELTPDWVNIDHRRGAAFAPGDMTAFVHDLFEDAPDINVYVEAVHRLSDLGVVVTQRAHGTSQEGFEAEWREIGIFMFEGDLLSRCELFDEADLDAALAQFEQLSPTAPQLENAASRVHERFLACFAAGDWDAIAEIMAEDFSHDDRRPVVGAGVQHGRDAYIVDMRAVADLWNTNLESTVVAIRGERLVLMRNRLSDRDEGPEAFSTEVLAIGEIDANERGVAVVTFDVDDFDDALAELDARYLVGEAAAHARTWSVIAGIYAGFNRREPPATTPDSVFIDHRPLQNLGTVDLVTAIRSMWDVASDLNVCIEAVHRLSELGAVVTQTLKGTSQEGLDAEWRTIEIFTVEGDLLSRCEAFDETDLDAALARFEELQPRVRQLENAASRLHERFLEYYAAADSQAMAEMLADNYSSDDRRRVVGSGVRHGRDAHIADMRARAELWNTNLESTVMAIRGERLALMRIGLSDLDEEPEAFSTEVLAIGEIGADERLVATVTFDLDEIDAAFEELDARYLAGEAAAHAHTWSAIAGVYVAFNRRELPAPDYVTIDHRRATLFTSSELAASIRDSLDLTPDLSIHIEAVHRLNNFGALLTNTSYGTSHAGFDAEWRMIQLLTVEGDRINRLELFDETDLDAALARCDELHAQPPRLENAVCRIVERYQACFLARDWAAMAQLLADDIAVDDRRRPVNAGVRRGRDVHIADNRAAVEVGAETISSSVIATRSERLALYHVRSFNRGFQPGEAGAEMLTIAEIDADERIVAIVSFDIGDIDAAYEELDARYLAGEAAAYAQFWSAITKAYARLNRHELPPTMSDWVTVDHRVRATFEGDDLNAYTSTAWEQTPDIRIYVEAVHRLSNLGAVCTHIAYGRSEQGFEAEWRMIELLTFGGDTTNRCELFDEADIDVALARFDELQPQPPWLENAASQVVQRFLADYVAGEWDAIPEMLADDFFQDDRRRVVGAGVRHGRDAQIVDMQTIANLRITNMTSTVTATRGERLVLVRCSFTFRDQGPEAFVGELLGVAEINAHERVIAAVLFDLDDIDAAFEELDARYLAGEAVAHTHAWSAITSGYAAFNRREPPQTTQDWVSIDHRRAIAFASGQLIPYMQATWDMAPDINTYIEAAHRLSNLGAVVAQVSRGTSQHGFDGEWREIIVVTVEGDLINRIEIFDEADVDAALARFEELHPQAPRLVNVATQVAERFLAQFAAGEWDAMPKMMADNFSSDDRRRVVGAGVRHGRNAQIMDMRAIADLGITNSQMTHLATRGERLALSRTRMSSKDQPFYGEMLDVLEINADAQIVKYVVFDSDDIDAAFEELEARYLVGEGAAHARTWSVIARTYAAFNRHEFPSTTPDSVYIDHRPLVTNDASDLAANIRATWELMDVSIYVAESVHRLSELGAVVTQTLKGTSKEGLDVEYRMIDIFTVQCDLLSRCEAFDEADLDAALARFEELHAQAPRLENAASQVEQRFLTYFAARDWDAYAEILSDDVRVDDRRHIVNAGVRHGRDAEIASMRAIANVGVTGFTSTVIAIRGRRLALGCYSVLDGWGGSKVLSVTEINAENQIVARAAFDPDDIDAAFEELDARYLAGEAAAHAHTWSVLVRIYAAFNRHELYPTTPDWVNADHRRGIAFASGDMTAYLRAGKDLTPHTPIYVETVHRLSDFGAVVTQVMKGTSRDGFDAEWQEIGLFTFDGDLISRCELFDVADVDAALARFDEVSRQPLLENAATRTWTRVADAFNRRDVDGLLALASADSRYEDRRKGLRDVVEGQGRRNALDVMFETVPSSWRMEAEPVAVRGSRLSLTRGCYRDVDDADRPIAVELLHVVELGDDDLVHAFVSFDPDDIGAALEELDARYLAGEAASHAHTWSVITRAYVALNRRELFPTTPDWVNIDHRRGTSFAPGEMPALLDAAWNLTTDLSNAIESVHRLDDLGAVVTHTAHETSQEGFDAEWRVVSLATVEGDRFNRCEVFDEADLDVALARFEELHPQAQRLENAVCRVGDRFLAHFAASEWDAMAEMLADNHFTDDRRRVVGAGVRHGREAQIADFRALAGLFTTTVTLTAVATRGERLVLRRARFSDNDHGPKAFVTESLTVGEIDADERIVAFVTFDLDDIDAAFEELDARYLAGEAAAHAHTWSVISQAYAALSRHEVPPTTPDCVVIDHRRAIAFEGDMVPYVHATWDVVPDAKMYIEALHGLTNRGAVVTWATYGTSQGGFDAEWRGINILTVEGDLIDRGEIFDEADLDEALARFDELDRQTPLLENAATRAWARVADASNRRDIDGLLALSSTDGRYEDRRKGLRDVLEGPARRKAVHAMFETAPSSWRMEVKPIAIRGVRLALIRTFWRDTDFADRPIVAELMHVTEVSDDDLLRYTVNFDPDDINGAFAELTARWIATGEIAYPAVIESVDRINSAINRHDWDAVATYFAGAEYVNHRQLAQSVNGTIADWLSSMQTTGSLVPDLWVELAEVLARSAIGIVGRMALKGTSTDGAAIEIPFVVLILLDGERVARLEAFDENQRELALTRLQELNRPV